MENSYGYPPEGYDSLSMLTQAADAMSASKEQSTTMSNLQNQNEGYDQYQLPDVTYENSTSMSETHAPQMHGAYHPSILSARNMEAFVFGPGSQGGRGYGYHSAAVGPQGYYGNDLGILNAESYDDGSGAMRAQAEFDARAMVAEQDQTMPFGLKGAPRQVKKEKEFLEAESGNGKRKRKVKNEPVSTDVQDEIDGGEDDEDVRKKTRGRPRVDTKDETPAERRRTQIRLAQRAYRNRKETTISSLEKRVQDLRGTNEEMSSIFISLYDFAVSKGILGREPELARQLQSATERFVSLASTATNDDSNTEENASGENQKQGPEQDFNRRVRGRVAAPEQAQQQISPPVSEAAANPWGGYTLADSAIPFQEGDFQYRPAQAGRSDVQIITRPTEDNASFPFDFMGLGQFRTEDLGVENPGVKDFPQLYTARAGTDLPPPSSFAFTEVSFARRIHRDTTEAALRLANLKSPPKTKYQRVFGITAMYETNDAIVIRLKRVLAATSKDTLQQWKEPFVHLGGAGTFYPMSETDRNSDLMPKFQSGYSMGPFSSDVCRVNDLIQQDMTFNLPGFEGDFFDANDVEGYLRARGVEIPPAADFYCAEIDLTSFGDIPSRQNSNTDSSLFAPNTPHNSMDNILVNPQSDANSMFMGISKSAADPNLPYDQGQAAWDANALGMQGSVISDFNSINKQSANPGYQVSTSSKSVYSPRSIVTINVRTFIAELISRCVCLGRAPGFRPSDVNKALMTAIKAGYSS